VTATRLPRLALRMLRYRVAVMMWLFMLLGAAFHGQAFRLDGRFGAALVALAASYVAATTLNDLADEAIDRINHPRDAGRPLISREASRRDLWVCHAAAIAAALAASATLGWAAVTLVAASLVIGHTYSMGPVRFSYRTVLAPLVLGVAYVWLPYGLGLVAAQVGVDEAAPLFAGGLYALFLARIVLKDFRDREGDHRGGRPTLLLRYGKDPTCLLSLTALVIGTATLLIAVRVPWPVTLVLIAFAVAIASRLHALRRASTSADEQVAIGVAAKMGNGMLITVLAVLLLRTQGAGVAEQVLLALALATVYAASFATLIARPRQAVVAYKG